jgi:hypothetical protein
MEPLLTVQTPETVLFWFLAPLSVLAALGMLLVKKAVHSALLLAWVMVTLAIFYIAQGAVFLGIVQVVVYTGAVMMLFLFILMLVGVDSSDSLTETITGLRPDCDHCSSWLWRTYGFTPWSRNFRSRTSWFRCGKRGRKCARNCCALVLKVRMAI